MPMGCPSCGRPLASGAKCVYCGQGTQFKKREQLAVPKGTVKERGKSSGFPWGTILIFLVIGGIVAACFLHPDLNAKIRSFLPN